MKRVCAWCLKEMGVVETSERPDTEISHGICENCLDNLTAQSGMSFQHYLDSLPLPVFMVDGNVEVIAVNSRACAVLGKKNAELIHHLGGNVFECQYARLPLGCGRTIHCSGCTIRKAVTRTFETGEPLSMVPATLSHADLDHPTEISLYITTAKVGDMFMLRVDKMV